ncbi:hypothetical protein AOUC001_00260 [Proteus mirabilis]|nr:hypothetical protein AOUC001_00260 [Proteus mirabilis]
MCKKARRKTPLAVNRIRAPPRAGVLPNGAAGQPARPAPALTARSLYLVGLPAETGTTCSVARRGGAIRCYAGFTECLQIVSGDERPLCRISRDD